MPDAYDQMDGHGGSTGKDPDSPAPGVDPKLTEPAPQPPGDDAGEFRTGEKQAQINQENDPPA